jgi:hypothetical protein
MTSQKSATEFFIRDRVFFTLPMVVIEIEDEKMICNQILSKLGLSTLVGHREMPYFPNVP